MVNSTQIPMGQKVKRSIKGAIVAVFIAGVRRWNPGAIVNAAVGLVVAYLPDIIEGKYDVEFRPWQRVYTEIAMLMHAVGMLGPYDDTWWWDHFTHTLSASLLGGAVYVAAQRCGRDSQRSVLVAIVGGGILWEVMEYTIHGLTDRLGLEPVLIPYSARDTIVDLFFNLLGALLVLLFGDRLLQNFTQNMD
ncbi:hypothetical protein [Haladaptatus sp. DYF46]|uniref:hypothetical protein n=1 Tax=Haladaptatus sp. DYF46 TaxID=2886041 RepID=UPI001E3B969C|nr:hypothetical protein [Haladaptatus sp. DYF46]